MVLGPRIGNNVEQTFYDELLRWLNTERETASYFVHYFSTNETRKAMESGEYSLKSAKEKLEKILNKCGNNNFIIRTTPNLEAATHVICDTGLGLNFKIGNNRYYLFLPCFLTKQNELQGIITNIQGLGSVLTINDVRNLYDGYV